MVDGEAGHNVSVCYAFGSIKVNPHTTEALIASAPFIGCKKER